MITKSRPAEIKAVGTEDGLEEGEFTALVSAFENIDTYGDVVMKGAFADTLEQDFRSKGDPLPCIWSHQWADPFAHIGFSHEYEETEAGLVVKSKIDVDSNPTAAQVYNLLKNRRVKQFSFGFDVLDGGWGKRTDAEGKSQEVYELRRLKLYEVGPCLVGVNQSTELLAIKGQTREASDAYRKASAGGSATQHNADQFGAWLDLTELNHWE